MLIPIARKLAIVAIRLVLIDGKCEAMNIEVVRADVYSQIMVAACDAKWEIEDSWIIGTISNVNSIKISKETGACSDS